MKPGRKRKIVESAPPANVVVKESNMNAELQEPEAEALVQNEGDSKWHKHRLIKGGGGELLTNVSGGELLADIWGLKGSTTKENELKI